MKDYTNYYPSYETKVNSFLDRFFQLQLNGQEGEIVNINGVSNIKVVIQEHTNPMNEDKNDRKLLCDNSVAINRGNVVVYNNENWLVISTPRDNGVYITSKIIIANEVVKWKDANNVIQILPCSFASSYFSDDGIEITRTMITEDTKMAVTMPNTSVSQSLYEGYRLILGKKVYKVTLIDDSMEGLLTLRLTQEQKRENDDIVNKLAEQEIDNMLGHDYSLDILSGSSANMVTDSHLQLSISVFDNGDAVTVPLVCTSNSPSICTVNNSGYITAFSVGSATITVSLASDPTISKQIFITVKAGSVSSSYTVGIAGSDTILMNNTESYSAKIYNNGVYDNTKLVTWSLTNEDGTDNKYVLLTTNGNTCVLTSMKGNLGKIVQLKATYTGSSSVYKIMNIAIDGIL